MNDLEHVPLKKMFLYALIVSVGIARRWGFSRS